MIKPKNWIWQNDNAKPDEHVQFLAKFDYKTSDGATKLVISADTDYIVYLNGKIVEFGQYPDFPHYKVYTEYELSPVVGENVLGVEVWYKGVDTQTYFTGKAGLFFEVRSDAGVLAESNEKVLSRISPTYLSYATKEINRQLGFTYSYDANKEDGWKSGDTTGFAPAVLVKVADTLLPRPIKKLETLRPYAGKLIKQDGNRYLFDFSREEVGVFRLRFNTKSSQKLKICWGEHIVDGWVRDIIGTRDFSIEYTAKAGDNDFMGRYIRLGMRYVEIRAESELSDLSVAILPRIYPLNKFPYSCTDKDLQPIYDVCERTLELCMHDHYEDCPWREQALYAMDSRNQMLCGYYAFREFAFARASLKLMSEDRREDGLLSICTPAGVDLTIPSFSLHYFTEVREYCDYSGDFDFAKEIYSKLKSILDVFFARQGADGLIRTFTGTNFWNFYEWSTDSLSSEPYRSDPERVDVVLNGLFSIALQHFGYISDKIGVENDYLEIADKVNQGINQKFLTKDGLYRTCDGDDVYSELAQSICVLCGAADKDTAKRICEGLAGDNDWTKITLSMKCFKYDALLKTDAPKYRDCVLSEIKSVYNIMLDAGATSVWETEKGEKDFDNAGSLCHGWSALPVYYFHLLKA